MKSLLKVTFFATILFGVDVLGEGLDAKVQTQVDAMTKQIQGWAADPVIVSAVKSYNAAPPADSVAMNQDKWKALSILDPFVRGFSKSPAGEYLKGKKSDAVTEAFLSGADGNKVAFIGKPSNWCHKGKDKHDVPITGKNWQGTVEVDESTGLQQIQVAVSVLDGGKPIGSLIVGLSLSKLTKE